MITACASAALLAACSGGEEAATSERETAPAVAAPPANSRALIADVVRAYFNALAAGDAERVCAQMSSAAQIEAVTAVRESGAATCQEAVEQAVAEVGPEARRELLNTSVTGIRIHGDTATAKAVEGRREVRLMLSDGRWQVLAVEQTGR